MANWTLEDSDALIFIGLGLILLALVKALFRKAPGARPNTFKFSEGGGLAAVTDPPNVLGSRRTPYGAEGGGNESIGFVQTPRVDFRVKKGALTLLADKMTLEAEVVLDGLLFGELSATLKAEGKYLHKDASGPQTYCVASLTGAFFSKKGEKQVPNAPSAFVITYAAHAGEDASDVDHPWAWGYWMMDDREHRMDKLSLGTISLGAPPKRKALPRDSGGGEGADGGKAVAGKKLGNMTLTGDAATDADKMLNYMDEAFTRNGGDPLRDG